MRKLFLIRHAKSSWEHPGLRDFERPLNARGLRDAPRMAALLAHRGLSNPLLVSSPAKRAYTTACFFADALGIAYTNIRQVEAIYESSPQILMQIISQLPAERETVLLFGHNPTFTDFANRFASEHIENVPTCGIVQIDSNAPDWVHFYDNNASVSAKLFPKEVL